MILSVCQRSSNVSFFGRGKDTLLFTWKSAIQFSVDFYSGDPPKLIRLTTSGALLIAFYYGDSVAILGMLNFQFVRYFNGLDICSPIQFRSPTLHF